MLLALTRTGEDDIIAAWVLFKEICYIINFSVHNKPAVLVADMPFALIKRVCLVCHLERYAYEQET